MTVFPTLDVYTPLLDGAQNAVDALRRRTEAAEAVRVQVSPPFGRAVVRIVAECASYPAQWEDLLSDVSGLEQADAINSRQLGEQLLNLFRRGRAVMADLRGVVERLVQDGLPVGNLAALDRALEAASSFIETFQREWPWPPTPEELRAADEEFRRGECKGLDESFAEVAGVSPDEWRARVAAHQQRQGGKA